MSGDELFLRFMASIVVIVLLSLTYLAFIKPAYECIRDEILPYWKAYKKLKAMYPHTYYDWQPNEYNKHQVVCIVDGKTYKASAPTKNHAAERVRIKIAEDLESKGEIN
jgi:hypothetical protein